MNLQTRAELAGFDVGEVVELFELDGASLGAGVHFFAPRPVLDAQGARVAPVLDGQAHTVIPFESEGWEYADQLPQPILKFGLPRDGAAQNSAAIQFLALIEAHNDLLGARLTRRQVLRKNLDDGAEPNPNGAISYDIFIVEQRTALTAEMVSFRLRAAVDLESQKLPRRLAVAHCPWRYREGFCGYDGAAMFDLNGEPVSDPALDRCGKGLSDCKLRFGDNAQLPFGGFPGVGRTRAA